MRQHLPRVGPSSCKRHLLLRVGRICRCCCPLCFHWVCPGTSREQAQAVAASICCCGVMPAIPSEHHTTRSPFCVSCLEAAKATPPEGSSSCREHLLFQVRHQNKNPYCGNSFVRVGGYSVQDETVVCFHVPWTQTIGVSRGISHNEPQAVAQSICTTRLRKILQHGSTMLRDVVAFSARRSWPDENSRGEQVPQREC